MEVDFLLLMAYCAEKCIKQVEIVQPLADGNKYAAILIAIFYKEVAMRKKLQYTQA